jgi:Formin Homology 2 Domain
VANFCSPLIFIVNLQELRKGLSDLRDGLKRIKGELEEYFADQGEKYARQMWNFVTKAKGQLEDLVEDVNLADSTFTEVIKYYGEEDKNMSSSEFYAIFKTFVTSYKVLIETIVARKPLICPYRSVKAITSLLQRSACRRRSGNKLPKRIEPIVRRLWMLQRPWRTKIRPFSTTFWKNCAMATPLAVRQGEPGRYLMKASPHSL